jgi:hypothetical protein
MGPTEFHEALGSLNLAQQRVAALFDVSSRAVRRWRDGQRKVPCGVNIVVHLLAAGAVTVEQVPARKNGGPGLSALLGVTEAEPEVTEPPVIVERPPELSTDVCRGRPDPGQHWREARRARGDVVPIGDPHHSDFHFCCSPVTAPPTVTSIGLWLT